MKHGPNDKNKFYPVELSKNVRISSYLMKDLGCKPKSKQKQIEILQTVPENASGSKKAKTLEELGRPTLEELALWKSSENQFGRPKKRSIKS